MTISEFRSKNPSIRNTLLGKRLEKTFLFSASAIVSNKIEIICQNKSIMKIKGLKNTKIVEKFVSMI